MIGKGGEGSEYQLPSSKWVNDSIAAALTPANLINILTNATPEERATIKALLAA
jgi:hypothetical protein